MPEVTNRPAGEDRPGRGRTRLAEVSLLVISFLVALGAAEGFLRAADRFRPPPNPPRCGYWDPAICDLYESREAYGYALRPSAAMEYLYPETDPRRRLDVVSNRHGFRSRRELDEPDDRPRVVVLGDSFIFGEGVAEDERCTEVLEGLSGGWRVDNLGMTGWGPDLMLRALEDVGVGVAPRAVILCLYTHDFRRVHPLYAGVGFPIPRFELRAGELVTVPYPAPRLSQRLRVLWAVSPDRTSYNSGMWDVHAAILDRFRELGRRHDFELGIVFLPGRADTERDVERRTWLRDYCAQDDVPFLDLTDLILSRPRNELFIHGGNPHWNADGHRLVGEQLWTFLSERVTGP